MNSDRLEGGIRHLRGRVKTATGALRGAPGRQAEGAFDQAAGAAQYAYGRARDRAEDLAEDGRHLARAARSRAEHLFDDGRDLVDDVRARGTAYGRQAVRYADGNRASTLVGLAAIAFAVGWLSRPSR